MQPAGGVLDHVASELPINVSVIKVEEHKEFETTRTMWLGITSFLATILLFSSPALSYSCIFSAAPPFQLNSDAVDWNMEIGSGTSCTRGLKFGPINISEVELVAPPQSGQVAIKGPSFSYTAKPDFQGEDDFILRVSGTNVKMRGVSDIKVTVSVISK